jgi:uncharacterized membrane protein YdfJ with MMPL/SSD domain
MTAGDWRNGAVMAVIGAFLGMAAHGLAGLMAAGFWVSAALVVLPFLALVLFVQAFDGLCDRLFPSGVRPAKAQTSERRPLARTLALPASLALGAAAGWLWLSGPSMGMLP